MTKKPTEAKAQTEVKTEVKTSAFMKKLTPSPELAAIVGSEPLPRSEVVKLIWVYIKKHGLQDAENKRAINADATLAKVFGKPSSNMFEMNKLISLHLS